MAIASSLAKIPLQHAHIFLRGKDSSQQLPNRNRVIWVHLLLEQIRNRFGQAVQVKYFVAVRTLVQNFRLTQLFAFKAKFVFFNNGILKCV